MNARKFQLTLGIIKPDASQTPHVLQIIKSIIEREKFYVVQHKITRLKQEEAEAFYSEHKGKFFFNRLVTFMSSGPLIVFILCHTSAISRWRQIMGPTKVYRTQIEHPKTIRGLVGLTDTRNTTHGSDSEETAHREISFFFPDFSLQDWNDSGSPSSTFSSVLESLNKKTDLYE